MQIKKLLTLLIASSMIVACGSKPVSSAQGNSENQSSPSEIAPSSDNGSSDAAPSSSEAPITSSTEAPSSVQPSSSAEAPSSSAQPSSSSEAPSSSIEPSSSVAPLPVLQSITVTAPTKVEYTTDDTALDLTGMVVTANFDNGTSQVIESGYTVSTPDFSTVGEQAITVTYEGKSDSFNINVVQAKPTAWAADVRALFRRNIYNYAVPFFYAPDLGLGELEWAANNGTVYAEGGQVSKPAEGEEYAFMPVVDLFIADGFAITVEQDLSDASNPTYHYELEKGIKNGDNDVILQVRMALTDEEGYFAEEGTFYFEISDPYYYSWEDAGFETIIKNGLGFTEDIPDFQAGGRFLKRYKNFISQMVGYGYAEFSVFSDDANYADDYLDILEEANWLVFSSTREDYILDAVSPNGEIRLGLDYNAARNELILNYQKQSAIPEMVEITASIFNVQGGGYVFSYSSNTGSYFYTFLETLGEGENLGDLVDKYINIFNSNVASVTGEAEWVVKAPKTQYSETMWYADFACGELGILIEILAFTQSGQYGVQVSCEEYFEVPDLYAPYVDAIGLTAEDFNVEEEGGEIMIWTQKAYDTTTITSFEDAIMAYANLLLNDDSLGFTVLAEYSDVEMSSGDAGGHFVIANDEVKIEFYAFNGRVQIAMYPYTPAPENAWAEAVAAALASTYPLEWDSSEQTYSYANYRDLSGSETLASVAAAIADGLLDIPALGLDILLSSTSDAKEAKILLYAEEGSVEILYSKYYHATRAVLFITVRMFDEDFDLMASCIGAVLGVNLQVVQEGVYGGQGRFAFTSTYSLTQYGHAILVNYMGYDLEAATALGFSLAQEGATGNNYAGIYTNDEGYTVQIILLGDANKDYTGYFNVFVILPTE